MPRGIFGTGRTKETIRKVVMKSSVGPRIRNVPAVGTCLTQGRAGGTDLPRCTDLTVIDMVMSGSSTPIIIVKRSASAVHARVRRGRIGLLVGASGADSAGHGVVDGKLSHGARLAIGQPRFVCIAARLTPVA